MPLDHHAVNRLYRDLARPLSIYFERRAGLHHRDDLVADTFARVLERRHTWDPMKGTAEAWTWGIAQNVLRNHRRKDRDRSPVEIGHHSSHEDSVIGQLGATAAVAALRVALAALPSEDRVFLASTLHGDSTTRSATERSRLHRIRRHLRTTVTAATLAAVLLSGYGQISASSGTSSNHRRPVAQVVAQQPVQQRPIDRASAA